MKKKSNSQSAFFNLRVLIGLFIAMAGISLALLATANPSRFVGTTSSHPQTAQMPQKYNPLARSANLQILPPGFDCSKIHRLGYDTMENFRAHLIMVACGVEPKGKLSPATAFSKAGQKSVAKIAKSVGVWRHGCGSDHFPAS